MSVLDYEVCAKWNIPDTNKMSLNDPEDQTSLTNTNLYTLEHKQATIDFITLREECLPNE